MKILQVTLGFWPAAAWGGPVQLVYQNTLELVRRGHEVTVYCTNLLDKKNKIQPGTFERSIDGIRVVYFDTWNLPWWPGTLGPIWMRNLKTYLRRELQSYNIIHLNGYRNIMNLQILNEVHAHKIPVVLQPHGTMQSIINSVFIKRIYDKVLGQKELKQVRAYIAGQETEKQQICAFGISPDRITIIPNGLNPATLNQANPKGVFRQRFGIPADQWMILFLGRINRKKGIDMLVEAFASLQDIEPILVIAGPDDGQLAEAQALVTKYQLAERVIFTGLLTGGAIQEAYRDADLFVLPCRTDTFPTTIMEACLAELPMVITEGCEIAHLVADRVAIVTPFDAAVFAQAMRRVLTDNTLYQKYRRNGHKVLQDTFSIQATVDKMEALYRQVIAEQEPRVE
jgi:glycosyltransferase involved in cell wall biosynthesis